MSGRGFEVRQRIRPAMLALRDAEDWARLELGDELLATRIREIHETLTDDVINGSTDRATTRERARRWDRYCLLRRHNPDASGSRTSLRLRRLQTRRR